MDEFDHLKIHLEDIILATDNFLPNKLIGHGGFGSVYKGELSHPEGLIPVACKRLDRKFGQGNVEFWKEIMTLSICKHENLISLLHFCIEGDERILVYEYASRGSLDRYLSHLSLTWTQRLKICIGAAHALKYLHDSVDTHKRILHRDIKSSNILLDEEWNAKVSDFGLSKFGPANQPQTFVVSNVVGTPGYCDPLYWKDNILSKESDVYSFGVVMFEVMCGRSCCEYHDGIITDILVSTWEKCFEEKRLDDIIFHGLKEHMDPCSLNTFSTIAYQCLKTERKERPKMAEVMQILECALEQQELFEDAEKRMYFERMNVEELQRIADLAVPHVSYLTQSQIISHFMEGLLVDNGKTWISVNKKGQRRELISTQKCTPGPSMWTEPDTDLVSRFEYLYEYWSGEDLRLTVKTQFLSPDVTYIINLVYDCDEHRDSLRIPFKYKLEETREYSTSCVAHVGEDGWLRTELFQFTSTEMEHSFDIHFLSELDGLWINSFLISIEGVEFCPVDFIEKNENKVDMQPTDIDWERRLPNDIYTKIVKDVEDPSITSKEVYFILRKGVYIDNSQQWFSISKKLKNRLMLPAREILPEGKSGRSFISRKKMTWKWKSHPGSRFNEVAEACDKNHLAISAEIESQLLSPDTKYVCYLVFKLPENGFMFEGIIITNFKERGWLEIPTKHYVYLLTSPHIPIIGPGEISPGIRKIKGHTKLRKDGWLEIPVWEFQPGSNSDSNFFMDGYLKSFGKWNFTGLLIQGIEFRPAKVS